MRNIRTYIGIAALYGASQCYPAHAQTQHHPQSVLAKEVATHLIESSSNKKGLIYTASFTDSNGVKIHIKYHDRNTNAKPDSSDELSILLINHQASDTLTSHFSEAIRDYGLDGLYVQDGDYDFVHGYTERNGKFEITESLLPLNAHNVKKANESYYNLLKRILRHVQ